MGRTGAADLAVIWEDPPARAAKPNVYAPIIEQLKMKPNVWAKVRTTPGTGGAYNTASNLRKAANGVKIETAVHKNPDAEEYWIYARYVPQGQRRSNG